MRGLVRNPELQADERRGLGPGSPRRSRASRTCRDARPAQTRTPARRGRRGRFATASHSAVFSETIPKWPRSERADRDRCRLDDRALAAVRSPRSVARDRCWSRGNAPGDRVRVDVGEPEDDGRDQDQRGDVPEAGAGTPSRRRRSSRGRRSSRRCSRRGARPSPRAGPSPSGPDDCCPAPWGRS